MMQMRSQRALDSGRKSESSKTLSGQARRRGLLGITSSMRALFGRKKSTAAPAFHHATAKDMAEKDGIRSLSQSSFGTNPTCYSGSSHSDSSRWSATGVSPYTSPTMRGTTNANIDNAVRFSESHGTRKLSRPPSPATQRGRERERGQDPPSSGSDTDTQTSSSSSNTSPRDNTHSAGEKGKTVRQKRLVGSGSGSNKISTTPRRNRTRARPAPVSRLPSYEEATSLASAAPLSPTSRAELYNAIVEASNVAPAPSFRRAASVPGRRGFGNASRVRSSSSLSPQPGGRYAEAMGPTAGGWGGGRRGGGGGGGGRIGRGTPAVSAKGGSMNMNSSSSSNSSMGSGGRIGRGTPAVSAKGGSTNMNSSISISSDSSNSRGRSTNSGDKVKDTPRRALHHNAPKSSSATTARGRHRPSVSSVGGAPTNSRKKGDSLTQMTPDRGASHVRSGGVDSESLRRRRRGRSMSARGGPAAAGQLAVICESDSGDCPPTSGDSVGAIRRAKVVVPDAEKKFIRSLKHVDVGDESSSLPPLLEPQLSLEQQQQRRSGFRRVNTGVTGDKCNSRERSSGGATPSGKRTTLVLDLDETLVSSTRKPCPCDFQIIFKIHNTDPPPATRMVDNAEGDGPEKGGGEPNGDGDGEQEEPTVKQVSYYVRMRPGLFEFLTKAAAMFELVVWTASGQAYADAIINMLDPDRTLFAARLYRDSCTRHRGLCVKDLRRLGRPMDSIILLDNFVYSFGFTLNNGIPITPWTGTQGPNDPALAAVTSVLQQVVGASDVRTPLVAIFDLRRSILGRRPSSLPPARLERSKSHSSSGKSRQDSEMTPFMCDGGRRRRGGSKGNSPRGEGSSGKTSRSRSSSRTSRNVGNTNSRQDEMMSPFIYSRCDGRSNEGNDIHRGGHRRNSEGSGSRSSSSGTDESCVSSNTDNSSTVSASSSSRTSVTTGDVGSSVDGGGDGGSDGSLSVSVPSRLSLSSTLSSSSSSSSRLSWEGDADGSVNAPVCTPREWAAALKNSLLFAARGRE